MFHDPKVQCSLYSVTIRNFALHFAMERLFSPCTRLRHRLESQGVDHDELSLQEIKLDVSSEDLLSAERAFTFADLYAILENEITLAWLNPHTAVARIDGRGVPAWWEGSGIFEWGRFIFVADGIIINAFARSHEHLMKICDVFLRLLAASVVQSVHLHNCGRQDTALINAATLAYLMERCQSLKTLTLESLELDESHIHVLGVHSSPDLKIVLDSCKLTRAGTSALAEVLGRNQGPTKLECCDVDNTVLADGLRGNSRLKSLKPHTSDSPEASNQELLAIAATLKENEGLVDLTLGYCWVGDEAWDAVCDSLKTHPALEVLDLRSVYTAGLMTSAVITSRIQSLFNMMKVNMSIHTIRLRDSQSDHVLFRESVIPFLESNRLRPRLLAIQRTRPITYRTGLLGRALLTARTDVNRFWMLLSGNAEVSFPAATATTTPVVPSLPTSATAAATRAASATGTSTSAVANVTTPTACQKRKAHP
jgi:hypothetical protein